MSNEYKYLNGEELVALAEGNDRMQSAIYKAYQKNDLAVVIYRGTDYYFENTPSKMIRSYVGAKLREKGYGRHDREEDDDLCYSALNSDSSHASLF